MVADALSRKPQNILATIMINKWQTLETLAEFNVETSEEMEGRHLGCLMVQPSLVSQIIEKQGENQEF